MFNNAQEFIEHYGWESGCTAKVLANLTDESLSLAKADGHNTLGDIAYHVASSPAMMMRECKWDMPDRGWNTPEGVTAAQIQQVYNEDIARLKEIAGGLSEEGLREVHHVFGMMDWPVVNMLTALISHEVHHRGQLSVLMRQAGLVVPSIYGPNAEETAEMLKQMAEQQ